jgi:hypothetical protein
MSFHAGAEFSLIAPRNNRVDGEPLRDIARSLQLDFPTNGGSN